MPAILMMLFCVWIVTVVFSRKGWPIYVGVPLGVAMYVVNFVLLSIAVATAVAAHINGVGAFILAFRPYLTAFLTVMAAFAVPSTARGLRQQRENKPSTEACPECGRVNAVTTMICPQCGHRKPKPATSNAS